MLAVTRLPPAPRSVHPATPGLRTGERPVYARLNGGMHQRASVGTADAGTSGRESRDTHLMTGTGASGTAQGIDAILMTHRAQLLRFLRAHGAGEAAEDLLQDLWMRMSAQPSGPVSNPLSYLYRAANNLMIDRARADRQARLREQAWTDAQGLEERSGEPSAEHRMIAQQELARFNAVIESLGARAATCFRRFRLEGIPQKQIAADLGVSLSTVESDLRGVYAALLAARRQSDDA